MTKTRLRIAPPRAVLTANVALTSSKMTTTATARGVLFLRRFLRSPREVGALCPSTRHLAELMIRDLDLDQGATVVEYGVGTGSFTPTIQRLVDATPGARYLGVEREPEFVDVLQNRFPTLSFANDQVEDIERLLAERALPAPQAILSGLPLILLPTMDEIIRRTEAVLAPGGEFRTFSYLQSYPTRAAAKLRRLLKETFDEHSISEMCWRNFPPAMVLRGKKRNA